MTLDRNGRIYYRSVGVAAVCSRDPTYVQTIKEWVVIVDTIGAGKLFHKEEKDDTGIGLNRAERKGKIGVKSLVVEYG